MSTVSLYIEQPSYMEREGIRQPSVGLDRMRSLQKHIVYVSFKTVHERFTPGN